MIDGSRGDLVSSLRGEYELLLRRVTEQRQQVDRLRALADQVEQANARDEDLLHEMAAVLGLAAQLRIDDLSPRLRGQRLQAVALQVLEAHWGIEREIHYREWFELVRQQGYRIGGKDPVATFLAQVHCAPGVERVGARSGRYRLSSG